MSEQRTVYEAGLLRYSSWEEDEKNKPKVEVKGGGLPSAIAAPLFATGKWRAMLRDHAVQADAAGNHR